MRKFHYLTIMILLTIMIFKCDIYIILIITIININIIIAINNTAQFDITITVFFPDHLNNLEIYKDVNNRCNCLVLVSIDNLGVYISIFECINIFVKIILNTLMHTNYLSSQDTPSI